MNKIIEEYAKLNNIIFGICDAADLEGLSGEITDIPFYKGDFRKRISPNAFLSGARSIIVLGVKTDRAPIFDDLEQVMAPSMSGMDYHKRLSRIADGLVHKMLEVTPFNFKIQVDSGPLIEREFAIKAGLGFAGKNKCIISHEFGSFFNIALIVVDIKIDNTANDIKVSCESCNNCIMACPANALSHDGKFDYRKCISYITQKKGTLSEEEMRLMGSSIYGCDICQNVCPHNLGHIEPGQKNAAGDVLNKILKMDSEQFVKNFKDTNFFWRGEETIKRNCSIVFRNME